jgi:hypothetical protein
MRLVVSLLGTSNFDDHSLEDLRQDFDDRVRHNRGEEDVEHGAVLREWRDKRMILYTVYVVNNSYTLFP